MFKKRGEPLGGGVVKHQLAGARVWPAAARGAQCCPTLVLIVPYRSMGHALLKMPPQLLVGWGGQNEAGQWTCRAPNPRDVVSRTPRKPEPFPLIANPHRQHPQGALFRVGVSGERDLGGRGVKCPGRAAWTARPAPSEPSVLGWAVSSSAGTWGPQGPEHGGGCGVTFQAGAHGARAASPGRS